MSGNIPWTDLTLPSSVAQNGVGLELPQCDSASDRHLPRFRPV
jgi:hypothetical protein